MKSWDCGIIKEPLNDHDLESNVQKIATNVADNIVTIASYLIVGYVIYGGYLYILASGDAGKVAAGKKTLVHAFIGLAIIGLTKAIISSIQTVFGIKAFESCSALEQTGCGVTPEELVLNSIQWFIGVAGVVAVAFIVLGGIKYITSSGDAGKLQQAKNTILHALIGLVIVGLAFAISNFFINVVNKASTEAGIEYSVINILNSFIVIAGIVAVVFIIIGGVGYMTSAGDAGKIKKAKDTILYSVIGLIVVALAFAIVNFAVKAINNDTSEEDAYLLQETSLPEKSIAFLEEKL